MQKKILLLTLVALLLVSCDDLSFTSERQIPTHEPGYEYVPANIPARLHEDVENEAGNDTVIVGRLQESEWVIISGTEGVLLETDELMGTNNHCFVVVIWGPTLSSYTVEYLSDDSFLFSFDSAFSAQDVEWAAEVEIGQVSERSRCPGGVDVWRINE